MEDTGVEKNSKHSSNNVNVYVPWGHLRPLFFFWSWLLQINLFLVLVVFFIITEVLGSGAFETLDRFWENLVSDGDAQL